MCASQMKQLITSAVMYADDYGTLPLGHRYRDFPTKTAESFHTLNPDSYESLTNDYLHTNEVWVCPNIPGAPRYKTTFGGGYWIKIFYLGNKSAINLDFGYQFPDRFGDQPDVPIFGELTYYNGVVAEAPHTASGHLKLETGLTSAEIGAQGGNFAFDDGSVRWIRITDTESYRYSNVGNGQNYGMLPRNMW